MDSKTPWPISCPSPVLREIAASRLLKRTIWRILDGTIAPDLVQDIAWASIHDIARPEYDVTPCENRLK